MILFLGAQRFFKKLEEVPEGCYKCWLRAGCGKGLHQMLVAANAFGQSGFGKLQILAIVDKGCDKWLVNYCGCSHLIGGTMHGYKNNQQTLHLLWASCIKCRSMVNFECTFYAA